MDLLRENTNESKHLGVSDILRLYTSSHDLTIERKTITRTMKTLRDLYGLDENGGIQSRTFDLFYIILVRR